MMVGARAALLGRHAEARKLFPLKADADAELETAAGDHINGCDVLGKADGIVKRHQEHPGCDADATGAGADGRGYGENGGKVAILDEVVLGQPNIIKAFVLGPGDLIEDFAVEPVGGLPPLRRVAEVVPKAKAYFSAVVTGRGRHRLPRRNEMPRRAGAVGGEQGKAARNTQSKPSAPPGPGAAAR